MAETKIIDSKLDRDRCNNRQRRKRMRDRAHAMKDKQRDPVGIFPVALHESEVGEILAEWEIAKHHNKSIKTLEWREMVGRLFVERWRLTRKSKK